MTGQTTRSRLLRAVVGEEGWSLGTHRWPPWWEWELEFSPHLPKRMEDRRFNEVDLRRMLERASGYRRDVVPDRWIIETRHSRWPWEAVVEPLMTERLLLVVTAYPVEKQ